MKKGRRHELKNNSSCLIFKVNIHCGRRIITVFLHLIQKAQGPLFIRDFLSPELPQEDMQGRVQVDTTISTAGGGTAGAATFSGAGAAGSAGGAAGATGVSAGVTGGAAGATGVSAAVTGGAAGATGGAAGATGGAAGATGALGDLSPEGGPPFKYT
jgi:hypothetical protein